MSTIFKPPVHDNKEKRRRNNHNVFEFAEKHLNSIDSVALRIVCDVLFFLRFACQLLIHGETAIEFKCKIIMMEGWKENEAFAFDSNRQ